MIERSKFLERSPAELSSEEILERWVAREGMRYVPLLIERGFILPEDAIDEQKVKAAMKDWRRTYVEDLSFEQRRWKRERVSDIREILEWRLGGWKGWFLYRPEGKEYTQFKDIGEAFDQPERQLPENHWVIIPQIAAEICETLKTKDLFLFRCGKDIAALDGTHTLAGLAYALTHGGRTPTALEVYVADFEEQERAVFERFCEKRQVRYGKYYKL
jgi:hypothetical protein